MFGAIIGDYIGSRFEFNNHRSKDFELLATDCYFTDDTIMTVAIMKALVEWYRSQKGVVLDYEALEVEAARQMRLFYKMYPNGEYGLSFAQWCENPNMGPYQSYGNGACMRVSPCAYLPTLEVARNAATSVTQVSHNHKYALYWAELLTKIIFYLRAPSAWTKADFVAWWEMQCKYDGRVPLPVETLQKTNRWDETCQGTVPVAIQCVIEANSFEGAIRNAVSVGGDTDTICAIAGSIAENLFEIPADLKLEVICNLPPDLGKIILEFEALIGGLNHG